MIPNFVWHVQNINYEVLDTVTSIAHFLRFSYEFLRFIQMYICFL